MKIFISSPSDMHTAREDTTHIIKDISRNYQHHVIESVVWETIPLDCTKSIQCNINDRITPAQCDIVIVILGARLGSKLSELYETEEGECISMTGTEWEYFNALNSTKKPAPAIMVFRKAEIDPPVAVEQEDLEQKNAVEAFFKQQFEHANGAVGKSYTTYQTRAEFRACLKEHLVAKIESILYPGKKIEKQDIKIFVSSPSDVQQEREGAVDVIKNIHRRFDDCNLQCIIWEDIALSLHDDIQSNVNKEIRPDECDIVIFILWSTLGSRLADKHVEQAGIPIEGGMTGTEWEFYHVLNSQKQPKPFAMVFRKMAMWGVESKQKHRVDDFFSKNFHHADGSFRRSYSTFTDARGFKATLATHLERKIREILDPENIDRYHGNPYVGLSAFDYDQSEVYSGRERETYVLYEQFLRQLARETAFIFVAGQSGNGKSSMVKAGFLPLVECRIKAGEMGDVSIYRWSVFRPSDNQADLFLGFAQALVAKTCLPELEEHNALDAIASNLKAQIFSPLRKAVEKIEQADAGHGKCVLILIIDQFEEVFTQDTITDEDRITFAQTLSALVRTQWVWIISTIRSDFYHYLDHIPELQQLRAEDGLFQLDPPDASRLREIITFPAQKAGLIFEHKKGQSLVEVLYTEALNASLTDLEFALSRLYEKRDVSRRVITFDAYHSIGGVEGAAARRATEIFDRLDAQVQAQLPGLLAALITIDDTSDALKLMATSAPKQQLMRRSLQMQQLVESFIQHRFIIASHSAKSGSGVIHFATEAFLRSWPKVQTWKEANSDFLKNRARIRQAYQLYTDEKRRSEYLLTEKSLLAAARNILRKRPDDMSDEVRQFIRKSAVYYFWTSFSLQVATVLFLIAIGATWFAISQWNDAELAIAKADKKNILALSSIARSQIGLGNTGNALILSLNAATIEHAHAYQNARTDEIVLYKALVSHQRVNAFKKSNREKDAFIRAHGKYTILEKQGNAYIGRIKDIKMDEQFINLQEAFVNLQLAVFSRNARYVVIASQSRFTVWDLQNKTELFRQPTPLTHADFGGCDHDHDHDCQWLATSQNDTLTIWDMQRNVAVSKYTFNPSDKASSNNMKYKIIFSASGAHLLVLTGRSMTAFKLLAGVLFAPEILKHKRNVNHAEFFPGKVARFVSVSDDETAVIWRYVDRQWRKDMALKHQAAVKYVQIATNKGSAQEDVIVTASTDNLLTVWTLTNNAGNNMHAAAKLIVGHQGNVNHFVISREGDQILSASSDRTARVWDIRTEKELARFGHGSAVSFVGYGENDIITQDVTGTISQWRQHRNEHNFVRTLGVGSHSRMAVFDPAGKRVAVASDQGVVTLWAVGATGKGRPRLDLTCLNQEQKGGVILATGFSPSGQWLMAIPREGKLCLWNVGKPLPGDAIANVVVADDRFNHVLGAQFAPNNEKLLMLTKKGDVTLWDLSTGAPRLERTLTWERSVQQPLPLVPLVPLGEAYVRFSPNGQYVAVSTSVGAYVWDLTRPQAEQIYALLGYKTGYMDFSHDSRYLIIAFQSRRKNGGWKIATWDAQTTLTINPICEVENIKTKVESCLFHKDRIYSAQFSHTHRHYLVTASGGVASKASAARVWKLKNGQWSLLKTLDGHKDKVYYADFSQDDTHLITASKDGYANLWRKTEAFSGNAASFTRVAELGSGKEGISFATFNPAGNSVITAHWDNHAAVWPVFKNEDYLKNEICKNKNIYNLTLDKDLNNILDEARAGDITLSSLCGDKGVTIKSQR